METTELTLPETTVTVLARPLTFAEYERHYQGSADAEGMIRVVVSADFQLVFERDYDSNVTAIAELAVAELGDDWVLGQVCVLGADPRAGDSAEFADRVLLSVPLYPGQPWSEDED